MSTDLIIAPAPSPMQIQATNDDHLINLFVNTRRGPRTRVLYEYTIRRYREQVSKPIRETTMDDLMAYAATLEHYRSGTQKQRLATIKSLFTFAHKIGYVAFNVGAAIPLPERKDTLSERILTPEEVMRLIVATSANPKHELVLRLLYRSAARVSEIVVATWRDLIPRDGDEAQITLFGKKGKTRNVLIPRSLYDRLVELRGEAGPDERILGMSRQRIWQVIRATAKRAGLEQKVSPHWLRHAHASHALENGASVKLVSETLGHESVATTSHYLHARPGESSGRFLKVG